MTDCQREMEAVKALNLEYNERQRRLDAIEAKYDAIWRRTATSEQLCRQKIADINLNFHGDYSEKMRQMRIAENEYEQKYGRAQREKEKQQEDRRCDAALEEWKKTATPEELKAHRESIANIGKVRPGQEASNRVFPYDPVNMFNTNSKPHSEGA